MSTHTAVRELGESLRDIVEVRSSPRPEITLVRPDGYVAYAARSRGGLSAVAALRAVLDRHFFHGKRHPAEFGAAEVTSFLTWLAVDMKVAASTQNQALSALLFLYREVLKVHVRWLDDLVYAKRPHHLPAVLTRGEVQAVFGEMRGVPRLMAVLLCGSGLRLLVLNRGPAAVRSPADRIFPG